MSLALFHEWQDAQQVVDQAISGEFVLNGGPQFVTKCGNRLVLYTCVEEGANGAAHLRYVFVFGFGPDDAKGIFEAGFLVISRPMVNN